MQKEPEIIKQE